MTTQGLQPQAPSDLRAQLVSSVAITNLDYTSNLPGSLVEDIASTDIAACVQSDSFLVDLVNSITPNGANPFLLQQFGILYGLQPQLATNTSVYVTFFGPPGFIIIQGFIVSDGSYQYVIQDGGIIGTDGQTMPLYAIATISGTWAVPVGSVTQMVTSVPTSIARQLTCSNAADGIPSTQAETISDFRDRTMTAGLAASTGASRYLKTLLGNVAGVQARLISARQDFTTGKFIIIVGGGDPYQVAYAIWRALFWPGGIIPAPIEISDVSSTNPAVVTTGNTHNLTTGMLESISGVQGTGIMPNINNTPANPTWMVTVIDAYNFSVPFNAATVSGFPPNVYSIGGVVSPNPIVEEVTIVDYPDTYLIPYTIPVQETVFITVTWQTDSPNYISPTAVATAVAPALQDYINGLPVGTTPINFYTMTEVFLDAIANILPAEAITALNFAVSIDTVGNVIVPAPNTGVVYGDPNSYFYTTLANITVEEGGFLPYGR
jgi:hypothetical protein